LEEISIRAMYITITMTRDSNSISPLFQRLKLLLGRGPSDYVSPMLGAAATLLCHRFLQ
jgi:hypothetical protein